MSKHQLTEQIASNIAIKGGAAVTGFSFWSWLGENSTAISSLCLLIGAGVTVFGFGVNWYYKHKSYKNTIIKSIAKK